MSEEKKNVCIVILGDIGRSPRMQYHALSLAEKGHIVDIVGYGETQPVDSVKKSPFIYYHYLCPVPQIPIKLLNYAFKTLFQAFNLLFLLCSIRSPKVLVVQNPPAIPSLVVCWLFCRIIQAKFVIDWHNYAHTIMELSLPSTHILVNLTKKCEALVGARADYNFCVTEEMRKDLTKWNIMAVTLYDKPSDIFCPISLKQKHDFLLKMGQKWAEFLESDGSTIFTNEENGIVHSKRERPGFVVSSTSWTADEDFSILLAALKDYESHIEKGNVKKLPKLICVITGKGHFKEFYCKLILGWNWKHVKVITPWLDSLDYPLMLASADLGVCLHTSSSGLDLPMKVVDMFGCCLPVLAYNFRCLHELVVDGKNSYTFDSSEELSRKLLNWFENFPKNEEQKSIEERFKGELETFQQLRWRENWNNVAYYVFK
ncbi:chitobiosyldiphosphodolichol beta-mannosyltransferase [Euwallacea fornicatus]|uniref:chitobiosyldiphosphodolichol beta-mannosyltransferase n=1 Tax=Euwallacea fornicatus TaxID=995702 RepID=UPI00338EB0AF